MDLSNVTINGLIGLNFDRTQHALTTNIVRVGKLFAQLLVGVFRIHVLIGHHLVWELNFRENAGRRFVNANYIIFVILVDNKIEE